MSLNCQLCQHPENTVLRTRPRDDQIRRTRQCDRCGHRWVTVEIDEQRALAVNRIHEKAAELMDALSAAGVFGARKEGGKQ